MYENPNRPEFGIFKSNELIFTGILTFKFDINLTASNTIIRCKMAGIKPVLM
jgi:hypothetical protein